MRRDFIIVTISAMYIKLLCWQNKHVIKKSKNVIVVMLTDGGMVLAKKEPGFTNCEPVNRSFLSFSERSICKGMFMNVTR